jgi:arylsulfatase A-like enzyme
LKPAATIKLFVSVFLLLLLFLSIHFFCRRGHAIERVVLLSVDTLRADYLGCYNPKMQTSPNIDRFAAENTRFDDALSQASNTAISHKSIFYSVYPHVHKTTIQSLPEERLPSPVEVLRQHGFRTAAFVGGGQLRAIFGFNRGFETYEVVDFQRLTDYSFPWLEKHAGEKFFLFLHTYRVHCPYTPPAAYRRKFTGWYRGTLDPAQTCSLPGRKEPLNSQDLQFVRDLYAANVNVVDDFFGRLVEKMKALDLYDRTLFIFLSDHGESLGEGDYIGHDKLRDVQLHIPMIMRIPDEPPRRANSPVEAIDVMPTIFETLRIEKPYPFEGSNLMNAIAQPNSDRVRFAEIWKEVYVRKGHYSLLFWRNEPYSGLFNVSVDPEERHDISGQNRELFEQLRNYHAGLLRADSALAARFVLTSTGKPHVDEETRESLKALGYVQ